MSITLLTGATQSGGDSVVFNNNGRSAGNEVTLSKSGSSLLMPRDIKMRVTIPATTSTNPGTLRAGVRLILGNRVEPEDGCCTVVAGTVIADINVSWPLSQPDMLVDELIEEIRGLVYTDAFVNLIKQGALPV